MLENIAHTPPPLASTKRDTFGRVGRNLFSNLAQLVITAGTNFLLVPILLQYLGTRHYAVLILGLAVAASLEAIDLGWSTATVRLIAAMDRTPREVTAAVTTIFYLLSGCALLGWVGFVTASPWLAGLFDLRAVTGVASSTVLAILVLSAVFLVPGAIMRSVMEARQRFSGANSVEICLTIAKFVVLVMMVRVKAGLLLIAYVYPLFALLRLPLLLLAIRRAGIRWWPDPRDIRPRSLVDVWHFGLLSSAFETAILWFFQIDTFLAAGLLPLADVSVLSVVRRFPNMVKQVAGSGFAVSFPMVANAATAGEQPALHRFLVNSTRLVLTVTLPMMLALFVWGDEILHVWIATDLPHAGTVLRILLVFSTFSVLHYVPMTYLFSTGRLGFGLWTLGAMCAIAIGGALWLARPYGLTALVASYAVAQALGSMAMVWYALTVARVPLLRWFFRAVAPVLAITAPLALWLVASHKLLPHTMTGILISVTITGFGFTLLVWHYLLRAEAPTLAGRISAFLLGGEI